MHELFRRELKRWIIYSCVCMMVRVCAVATLKLFILWNITYWFDIRSDCLNEEKLLKLSFFRYFFPLSAFFFTFWTAVRFHSSRTSTHIHIVTKEEEKKKRARQTYSMQMNDESMEKRLKEQQSNRQSLQWDLLLWRNACYNSHPHKYAYICIMCIPFFLLIFNRP